jgi:hypothetical protein
VSSNPATVSTTEIRRYLIAAPYTFTINCRFIAKDFQRSNFIPGCRRLKWALANEAGLNGQHIGHIDINEQYTLVDLPAGMPEEIFNDLKKV